MLKLSEVLADNYKLRYDPEFFGKDATKAYSVLRHHRRLGDLVATGYRVVYEETEIIPRDEGVRDDLPFFLQAADIETPFIRAENMGCVSRTDWERYTKGRIVPGELLIEVKGLAEKVALVPDDIPLNTLVTGTCYKMTTRDALDTPLLLAFLTSRYGQALKNRLKSNLLVAFVSKEDLFGMPVPDFSDVLKQAIAKSIRGAFAADRLALFELSEAERKLTIALSLDAWQPPEPLTYTRRASDVVGGPRFDAEFHAPRYASFQTVLAKRFTLKTLGALGEVLKGDTVPYSEDGTIPIIRSGDLRDIDDDDRFLRAASDAEIFELQRGDILISSIGFGSIGKVQVFDKPGRYGTVGEVTVVRQKELNPYYVAAYLRSRFGQMLIERYITGATGQLHLYAKDVAKIFVPVIPSSQQITFEENAKAARGARREAQSLLARAQRAVEVAIEQGEPSAMALLS